MVMTLRICIRCGEEKELEEFCKNPRSLSGRSNVCKKCHAKSSLEYRNNHKDAAIKRCHDYYHSHKEAISKQKREYAERNREKIKEYMKEYSKKYKERKNQLLKEFRQTPEGRIYELKKIQQRRHRNKQNGETLTPDQWSKILEYQEGKCSMCGKKFSSKLPATIDHIIPLSKGGGLTFENVQALCGPCNSSKCDKIDKSLIVSWF